jgi:hypothetical protein
LVSDEEADAFYKLFLELLDEKHKTKINPLTLSCWQNA